MDDSATEAEPHAERLAFPWPEVLGSEELRARDLSMATLAERLGVSAAYLRLLRQGKRSPSPETAGRLLDELGYRIEKTQTAAGTVDIVATDATGRVIVASTKTRAPGSSVEERMERLVKQAEKLEEHLQAAEPVVRALGWLETWSDGPRRPQEGTAAGRTQGATADTLAHSGTPREAATAAGAPLTSLLSAPEVMEEATQPAMKSQQRAQVEQLLTAVADADLPLVAAYLTALVERNHERSAPTPGLGPRTGGP